MLEDDKGSEPPVPPSADSSSTGSSSTDGSSTDGSSGAAHAKPPPPPMRGTSDGEQSKPRQLASAHNYFYAPVNAPSSVFGTAATSAADGRSRARTGRLTHDDIDAALHNYVRPVPLFEKAAEALHKVHAIVLVGAVGIGKRASAISLLRQVTDRSLAVLSPAITATDLAERDYEKGYGYVIIDWQYERRSGGANDFTWRTIRDQVSDADAYLIVTTAEAGANHGDAVPHFNWEPPGQREVLSAYLTGTAAEGLVDDIAQKMPDDCGVASVAAMAQEIADGTDPAEAMQRHGSDAAERVKEWFAQDRSLPEILDVAALAFTAGRSERAFEAMLGHLEDALKAAGFAKDAGTGARDRKKALRGAEALRPRRAERDRADGLIARETVAIEGSYRRSLAFKAAAYRHHVLAELWRNYDTKFWDAVCSCLGSVIDSDDTDSIELTQVAVAAGLATLAQIDMDEVESSYLHPWAGGAAGWAGQMTATYSLWWMCFDDSLAPVALRIAIKWANGRNEACKWTAAMTLSGELGVRYPTEASKRLWQLIVQAKGVSPEAISALAQLFATLAASSQNAGPLLALLDLRMKKYGRNFRDPRLRSLTHLVVLTVLSVNDPRTGHPAATLLLHANRDRNRVVARLWASVLRNRPYRREALSALLDAVAALEYVSKNADEDARAFGIQLAEVIPSEDHESLAIDFTNLQAHSKRSRPETAEIMRSLLAALERVRGQDIGEMI